MRGFYEVGICKLNGIKLVVLIFINHSKLEIEWIQWII